MRVVFYICASAEAMTQQSRVDEQDPVAIGFTTTLAGIFPVSFAEPDFDHKLINSSNSKPSSFIFARDFHQKMGGIIDFSYLLMVQKSHSQPPFGCILKPCK